MNHIKRLQADNKELRDNLKKVEESLTSLAVYLSSDKFAGMENNFVNASEMKNRVLEIRAEINL